MASDAVSVRATPGRWISMGWRVVKADLGNFILMTVIALALTFVGHFVVAGPLACGLFIAVRRRMQESRTEITDVFAGFRLFIDAFLICIISSVFLLIGVMLFFFPVFIVAALYLFAYQFLVDRRLSFWDALEASRKMVLSDLTGYLIFVIALTLLNFAGVLLFGVGILVTIPVTVAAIAAAYDDTVGFKVKPSVGPVLIG
jgi:uncharacterized membrane protein